MLLPGVVLLFRRDECWDLQSPVLQGQYLPGSRDRVLLEPVILPVPGLTRKQSCEVVGSGLGQKNDGTGSSPVIALTRKWMKWALVRIRDLVLNGEPMVIFPPPPNPQLWCSRPQLGQGEF